MKSHTHTGEVAVKGLRPRLALRKLGHTLMKKKRFFVSRGSLNLPLYVLLCQLAIVVYFH